MRQTVQDSGMANTPQFTLRLDPRLRSALEVIAAREKRSLSNLIELACERLVEADRKQHYPPLGSVSV